MPRMLWQWLDWKPYWRCYLIANINAMSLITWKEVWDILFRKFINDMLVLWHNPKYGKHITAWPKSTIPRWEENMGDKFVVEKIEILSPKFFANIFKWIPMCIAIWVGEQYRKDREDWQLDDVVLDDESKNGHVTVLKWLKIYDSRWDQLTYSVTRQYLRTVKWLVKYQFALVLKEV